MILKSPLQYFLKLFHSNLHKLHNSHSKTPYNRDLEFRRFFMHK